MQSRGLRLNKLALMPKSLSFWLCKLINRKKKSFCLLLQNNFLMRQILVRMNRNCISPFIVYSVMKKKNSTDSKIIFKQSFTKRKHRPYISKLFFFIHCIVNLKKCKKVQINWKFNSNCKQLLCNSEKYFCSFTSS